MSCCCCCCSVSPSGEGIRKKERLVTDEEEEEEEEAGGGEGERRRNMDVSLLRQQYRCTKERQRRRTQVLLFRTVSEQLSEAVSIVPVTQGFPSPWEPNGCPPPPVPSDLDPTNSDPWHVHLCLHKRFCPGVIAQLPASSAETTNASGSSRCWSPSTDATSSRLDVDSTSESVSSSRATSPFHHPKDVEHMDTSRRGPDPERSGEEPEPESSEMSGGEPDPESSERSRGPLEKMCPIQASNLKLNPSDESAGSFTGSDEHSTPAASIACSSSTHEDLRENEARQSGEQTSDAVRQSSSTSAWNGSRQLVTPALRWTRQLSVGGLGSSSTGVYQTHNFHPFPHRKTPRISEAAKRLGMYSSF